MKKVESNSKCCEFAFNAGSDQLNATGQVRFIDEAHDLASHNQQTSELITIDSTWDNIQHQSQPDGEKCTIGGAIIYRLLAPSVVYRKVYQLIQSFCSCRGGAKALLKVESSQLSDNHVSISPVVIEGVLQVAATHANLFRNTSLPTGLCVCTQIKCIQFSPCISWETSHSGWEVVARSIRQSTTSAEYDIYAFASGTGKLLMTIYGVRFQ